MSEDIELLKFIENGNLVLNHMKLKNVIYQ